MGSRKAPSRGSTASSTPLNPIAKLLWLKWASFIVLKIGYGGEWTVCVRVVVDGVQ